MFGTIGEFAPFRLNSEWLKEHSQLNGFNRVIASGLPKWLPSQSEGEIG